MYVREQNNGSLGTLLDGCDLDEEYLLDPNNWISHAFLHVLYHRMIAILGDENSVYKMALASGRFQSLGLLDGLARLLGRPKLIYEQATKYNRLLKLNGDVYIHALGDSWVVLEDRYHNSAQKTRYDCDYTRGVLVGIPTIFDMPPAHVEEIECQVAPDTYGKRAWPDTPGQGAKGCLYKVRWETRRKRIFGRRATHHKAVEDLLEANRRIQEKYEEVKRLASDLEAANKRLLESQRQLESNAADLRASEERYRFLADNVSDIIWTFSLDTMRFTYVSPSVRRIRGFTSEESIQQSLQEMLAPQSLEAVMRVLEEELAKENEAGADPNRSRIVEVQQLCKDGSYRWAEAMTSFIRNEEGRPIGILGVTRDISERKQAEEKIKTLLSEKELLLREVHHRIKNHMGVIMGLLYLQSNTLKDPAAIAALEDSRSRVQSMMVLYDKLYRSADFREIPVKKYLTSLIDEIVASFPSRQPVRIETEIDDFVLGADALSPMGMILNELLTNAIKHAFAGRENGVIGVSLTKKETHVTLTIQDNGVGIPQSTDAEAPAGFGMKLIRMLTAQLQGTVRLERQDGSAFIIEFDV